MDQVQAVSDVVVVKEGLALVSVFVDQVFADLVEFARWQIGQ